MKRVTGRKRRRLRIRKKLTGTGERPRLCVFRSNQYIYAQVIDDTKQVVLCRASSFKDKNLKKMKKIEAARETGKQIAALALEKGIKKVAFDRAGYKYHGRIKALAEGAREQGLEF